MAFKVRQRGKVAYYYEGDTPLLSNLVVETLPDGDLKLYFSGLTGGHSATSVLGLDSVTSMDPDKEGRWCSIAGRSGYARPASAHRSPMWIF